MFYNILGNNEYPETDRLVYMLRPDDSMPLIGRIENHSVEKEYLNGDVEWVDVPSLVLNNMVLCALDDLDDETVWLYLENAIRSDITLDLISRGII